MRPKRIGVRSWSRPQQNRAMLLCVRDTDGSAGFIHIESLREDLASRFGSDATSYSEQCQDGVIL